MVCLEFYLFQQNVLKDNRVFIQFFKKTGNVYIYIYRLYIYIYINSFIKNLSMIFIV